jgi:hypothetical protein
MCSQTLVSRHVLSLRIWGGLVSEAHTPASAMTSWARSHADQRSGSRYIYSAAAPRWGSGRPGGPAAVVRYLVSAPDALTRGGGGNTPWRR